MNERKGRKLFGIFNIVDVILILLVLVAGIIAAKLFLGGGAEQTADSKPYTYVVMGQEVLEETAGIAEIGGNAYNSSTGAYLGQVTAVESEPHCEVIYDRSTGTYKKAPIPEYCDLSVTITGNGTETERDITVEGTIVKVGMELNVKGKGYAFKGYVVDVREGA